MLVRQPHIVVPFKRWSQPNLLEYSLLAEGRVRMSLPLKNLIYFQMYRPLALQASWRQARQSAVSWKVSWQVSSSWWAGWKRTFWLLSNAAAILAIPTAMPLTPLVQQALLGYWTMVRECQKHAHKSWTIRARP